VKRRDGHRCTFVGDDGERCRETTGLHAHHLVPGSHDVRLGVTLCSSHHRAVDTHAR
jgi:hypothetical protein